MSKDFGKTWEKTDAINDINNYKAIQPSILTYKDGSLQALSRTRNRVISSSWSYDNGKTWSLMQSSGLQTTIPELMEYPWPTVLNSLFTIT